MKYIDNPDKMVKEIIKKTYIISSVPIVSSLVTGKFKSLLGFIFGLVIATLVLRLRLVNIKRSIDMSEGKANTFIRNRYFIEYIIYFAVLFVAARNPSVNFLAAAIGLFMMKFTVILLVIIDIIKNGWKHQIEKYE